MSVADRVREVVAPICTDLGLNIYDVEHRGSTVRVTVERAGGVDLEALSLVTRLISRELDHRDPVPGRYHLEVSSPGLERVLRTPEHFRGAVGQTVSLRLHPGTGDLRRLTGVITGVGEDDVTVLVGEPEPREHTVRLADIERARTTFSWGPAPKPGKGHKARTPSAPEQAEDSS